MVEELLAERVRTSRILGKDPQLVLYGGGNTSFKADDPNTGQRYLWVKGSGYDLADIDVPGFTKLPNAALEQLLAKGDFDDVQMMDRLNALKCDSSMPSPSVEALMHSVIPYAYVDHTHASSVVTLSNSAGGLAILADLFPDFLIVPYQMAGKLLSLQVRELVTQGISAYKGIILQHHGVVTYSDDANVACQRMLDCEQKAADYLSQYRFQNNSFQKPLLNVHAYELQQILQSYYKKTVYVRALDDAFSDHFAKTSNWVEAACRGTLTPEHVLRLKPFPMLVTIDIDDAFLRFRRDYQLYYLEHAQLTHIKLNDCPKWCVIENVGVFCISFQEDELRIIADIARENMKAISIAEQLSRWQPLPKADLFDIEYWALEQRKLAKK